MPAWHEAVRGTETPGEAASRKKGAQRPREGGRLRESWALQGGQLLLSRWGGHREDSGRRGGAQTLAWGPLTHVMGQMLWSQAQVSCSAGPPQRAGQELQRIPGAPPCDLVFSAGQESP